MPPVDHPLSGKDVVVTGPAGHLGANLLPLLVATGARVRVVVRATAPRAEVEAVRGDVCDPATLGPAFSGAEIVFHLAAKISIVGDPDGSVARVNVEGARNVARAARASGVRRMVHVSSIHAFLQPEDGPMDESAARPTARQPAYDQSKAAGEAAVRAEAGDALEVVVANPTGILGPNDHGPSRMGRVFLHLYHRRLPALTPGGFDWVDARDVSAALVAMATRGRPGENYLLGGGWRAVIDLARVAAAVTGVPAPPFTVPTWLAAASAPLIAGVQGLLGQEPVFTREAIEATSHGSRDIRADKARAELGFVTRPHEETVRDVYTWFRDNGFLRGGPWAS